MARECRSWILGALAASFFALPAFAVDLSTIERRIAKEPVYEGKPKYALLVFGQSAETRIWLVQDGDVLYVDRNANGDLTEQGETATRSKTDLYSSAPGHFIFDVGMLDDGRWRHERVVVSTFPVAGPWPAVKTLLQRSPGAEGLDVSMNTESASIGGPIGKHVEQSTLHVDENGVLQWGDDPTKAPILHFAGPLRIQPMKGVWEPDLRLGRSEDLICTLATPGLGPGATVATAYEGLLPKQAFPRVSCAFPGVSESRSFDLKERCCVRQLYGKVTAPDAATTGTVTVKAEFLGWDAGNVAGTTTDYALTRPAPLSDQPVSRELKRTLVHDPRHGILFKTRFSPDGRQLLGYSIIENVVQVWDVDSGESLSRIEIGKGLQTTLINSEISPDWKTLYSCTRSRKVTPVQQDGKAMTLWDLKGEVHAWDLKTGTRLRSVPIDPAGAEQLMVISPDGSLIAMGCERAGVFDNFRPMDLRLFDTRTHSFRKFDGNDQGCGGFSPDGRTFLALESHAIWKTDAIHVVTTATGVRRLSIPIDGDSTVVGQAVFRPDGGQLAVSLIHYPKPGTWTDWRSEVVMYDVATGAARGHFSLEGVGRTPDHLAYASDGKVLAAGEWALQGKTGSLILLDSSDASLRREWKFDNGAPREFAFRPDGKVLAIATQSTPERKLDPDPRDVAQARIQFFDVDTGRALKELVAPRGIVYGLAFAPDGQTLATGSTGAVHLWDVSDLK